MIIKQPNKNPRRSGGSILLTEGVERSIVNLPFNDESNSTQFSLIVYSGRVSRRSRRILVFPYRDGGLGIQSIWGEAESESGQARTGRRKEHRSYIGAILGGSVQFCDESDRVLDLYRGSESASNSFRILLSGECGAVPDIRG